MRILLNARRSPVCAEQEWPLEAVTVECSHERIHRHDLKDCDESEDVYVDPIRRHILIRCELGSEQRGYVARIARRCLVHRTLETSPRIEDEMDFVA